MYIAASTRQIAADHAKVRRAAGRPVLPIRLCRWLIQAWANHVERQVARAVASLEHPGLLDEMREVRWRG